MKKCLLSFLLILVFFMNGCASVPEATAGKPAEKIKIGFLNVSSFPAFASVEIDGKHIGKTPLEKVSLSPGTHQVIISEGGYKNSENLVEIKPGETTHLGVALEKIYRATPEKTRTYTYKEPEKVIVLPGEPGGIMGRFGYYVCDYPKFVGHIDFVKKRNSDFYKSLTLADTMRLKRRLFSPRCWSLSGFPEWKSLLTLCLAEDDVDEVFMFSETASPGVLVFRTNKNIPLVGPEIVRKKIAGIEYFAFSNKRLYIANTEEHIFCISHDQRQLEGALLNFKGRHQPRLDENLRRALESIASQANYVAFQLPALPKILAQVLPELKVYALGWTLSSSYDVREFCVFPTEREAETYLRTQKNAFEILGWAKCVEIQQINNCTITSLTFSIKDIR